MIDFSERGCTLVDTTCGSVLNVWKNVVRYAQDGFTSIIHGKVKHEETRATASQALKYPQGRYLVVLDRDEAADRLRLHPPRRRPRRVPRALRRRRLAGLRSRHRSRARRLREPDDDADVGVAGDRRDGRRGDARSLRRRPIAAALPRVRHDLQRDAGAAGRGRGAARRRAARPDDRGRRLQQQQHRATWRGSARRACARITSRIRRCLLSAGPDPASPGRRAVDGDGGGSGDGGLAAARRGASWSA